ncbi:nuclear transport factor 2 family protein [Novosphingobium piscinae]|uniref:Nuclear transport factor 2 family protein n=1 Tax=Novosphingobium piscinae TaxID=1507448 RepID=A0A7X1FXY9_9SPHN|nr:nuclear transport factor 2 family protein [Novosphingobium piscinae]MBC2668988.1 nuclear transport factor 2 family protein [Novosphingobium piscinae]
MNKPPFDAEAALRDYVARRDITDAVQRYLRGLDRLDPDLVRSAFTADAWVDCGLMAGPAETFVPFAMELLGAMEANQHLMGQLRIELHDEFRASGEVYFQAWHASRDESGAPRDLFIAGRYVDEYACDNGEWKIHRRHLITDWTRDEPADRSVLEAPTTNRGGRSGEDFSERRNWPA